MRKSTILGQSLAAIVAMISSNPANGSQNPGGAGPVVAKQPDENAQATDQSDILPDTNVDSVDDFSTGFWQTTPRSGERRL